MVLRRIRIFGVILDRRQWIGGGNLGLGRSLYRDPLTGQIVPPPRAVIVRGHFRTDTILRVRLQAAQDDLESLLRPVVAACIARVSTWLNEPALTGVARALRGWN